MKETLKFINLKTRTLDQADKDIIKLEYQKRMDDLYQALDKHNPGGFDATKKAEEREIRDQNLKNAIQQIKNTHTIVGYFEIISDTDNPNVKKISILLSKNGNDKGYSEAQLFLLKDKLQKAYDLYNKVVAKRTYIEPFLEWDGKILFDDKQIKADVNSVGKVSDDISKQTGIDLSVISKMIDIAINKIDTKKL